MKGNFNDYISWTVFIFVEKLLLQFFNKSTIGVYDAAGLN